MNLTLFLTWQNIGQILFIRNWLNSNKKQIRLQVVSKIQNKVSEFDFCFSKMVKNDAQ